MDRYWLCVLRHTFTPRPLEAPSSSLCVTSSPSRRSWRSCSRGARRNRNLSTAASRTRSGRTRMRRSRERRGGGRRRGAGPRRQVSGTSVRGGKREIASSGATVMRELCGTGDFSFNLSAGDFWGPLVPTPEHLVAAPGRSRWQGAEFHSDTD